MRQVLRSVDTNWVESIPNDFPSCEFSDQAAAASQNGIFQGPMHQYYSAHRWSAFGMRSEHINKQALVRSVLEAMASATHFIAYLIADMPSVGTLTELGMAYASKKPILIITCKHAESTYFDALCKYDGGDHILQHVEVEPLDDSTLELLPAVLASFLNGKRR